nr:immunoglobulin heavy chain junction region [Macaca mulatta]MOV51786.1 immunoglobulin heavy chain junction region [Macaca mulatta]MOV52221.1 immunoglobulin heavy chain junction region [Macaca mulatta]
CARKNVNFDYW